MTNFHGFTLIELIVVITILVILGTIAFISLGSFSGSARDGSRVSDLANISKSLDLFYVKNGSLPDPSGATSVTYSWAAIWQQGTIWDSVINTVWGAGVKMSTKPIDPLSKSEYAYSLATEVREYSLRADYEGDTVAFQGIPGIETAIAATGNPALTYIRGTYNGIATKVSTGSKMHVIAVPNIMAASGALAIVDSSPANFMVHGASNSGVAFSPKVVFSSGSLPSNDTERVTFANGIIATYSGTSLASNSNIQAFISASSSTGALASVGGDFVRMRLGGSTSATTSTPPISDWRTVDIACDKADVTIWSQTWAWCNSTIGSLAINYNNGACYDYNGANIWWSNCYGTGTQENWTGISTLANGYSGAISGISTNIYGALYEWSGATSGLSQSNCLGTGIPGSNTACPCKAWYHIPSQAEWDTLETNLLCSGANKLTGDSTGWECMTDTNDTTNGLWWKSSNANSLRNKLWLSLAGYCSGGSCYGRGYYAYYWASSVATPSPTNSWRRYMGYSYASVSRTFYAQTNATSVRCIKD